MKNIANMLKQAQQMQAKMAEMQAQLDHVELTGAAGAGLVQVTLNGKGMMRKIKIDKSLLDANEGEVLEDLILAAFNEAKQRVETHVTAEMAKVTGGMQLPGGLKLPF